MMSADERGDSKGELSEAAEAEAKKDAVSLINNCNYFQQFMDNLKLRGEVDMTGESLEAVQKLRSDMEGFLKVTEEGNRGEEEDGKWRLKENTKIIERNLGGILKSKDVKDICNQKKYEKFSDEASSSESSDTDTSTDSEEERRRRKKKKDKRNEGPRSRYDQYIREKDRKSTMRDNTVPDYFRRMDSRQVPQLEKYKEESGMSLIKYLDKFERYCEENFRGSEEFWASELESHLDGKILKTYLSLKDQDDSYYEIKHKLIEYYKEDSYQRKRRYKRQFQRAKPDPGESLYLFSIRLAKIFRLLYPKKYEKKTKKLLKQFKKVIPKADRESLEMQLRQYRMDGKKFNWESVQKYVKLMEWDRDVDTEESDREESRDKKEVVINLGRGRSDSRWNPSSRGGSYHGRGNGGNQRNDGARNGEGAYRGGRFSGNGEGMYRGGGFSGNRESRYRGGGFSGNGEGMYRGGGFSGNGEGMYRGDGFSGNGERMYRGCGFSGSGEGGYRGGYGSYRERGEGMYGIDGRDNFIGSNKPLVFNQREQSMCYYCRKFGHFAYECWKGLGLCLVCGVKGHFVSDCPRKRGRSQGRDVRNNSYFSNSGGRGTGRGGNSYRGRGGDSYRGRGGNSYRGRAASTPRQEVLRNDEGNGGDLRRGVNLGQRSTNWGMNAFNVQENHQNEGYSAEGAVGGVGNGYVGEVGSGAIGKDKRTEDKDQERSVFW